MSSIRARVSLKDHTATVKVLIQHPMETGLVKDKRTGQAIPAHFIKDIKCLHNGEVVLQADWGIAISKNPYLSFDIDKAKVGDKINIAWLDNMGKSDNKTITISSKDMH